MKKLLKRLLCLALVCVLAIPAMACNNNADPNDDPNTEDAKVIYVQMYEGGYGSEWIQSIIEDFEAEYAAEGYEVNLAPPSAALLYQNIASSIKAGPKINKTDLFLGGDVNVKMILDQGKNFIAGGEYDYALADLTDLYNSKVYGEDVLYKDKLNSALVEQNEFNGKYYSTNWSGGSTGFVYNNSYFEQNNWKVPYTTDELINLIAQIKTAGYTPFLFNGAASYWSYALVTWWRQLASETEVEQFWSAKDEDGNYSAEVFNTTARLQAYELIGEMLYDNANFYNKSSTLTHIESQMFLYNKANKIAMAPSGDWVENEMAINGYSRKTSNVGFIKFPIASDAIYVYDDFGNQNYRFETVRSDEVLSAVVKAIDEGKPYTAVEGVSEADYLAIKQLRSYTVSLSFLHNAIIPVYANAKVGAKKFLAYLASDKALQKYYDLTGCFMPFDNSGVQLSEEPTLFQKGLYNASLNASFTHEKHSKSKIWYKTQMYFYVESPEEAIAQTDTTYKKTARQWFDSDCNSVRNNFDTYVALVS